MNRILFVCHGNICRSPMAQFIMQDLVRKSGLQDCFQIASAATSTEEIGNSIYPPAQKTLTAHGVAFGHHAARQLQKQDYARYDLLIGMDYANIRNIQRICGGDSEQKIHLLMDYSNTPGKEVADPWYTGNFETTWQDVLSGCQGLLQALSGK